MAESLGGRVAELRRRRGWSQAEFAKDLPLSSSYVSLIEADRRRPGRRVLDLLATRLGTTVEYLETGRGADDEQTILLELRFAELALRSGDAETARRRFAEALSQSERLGSAYHAERCTALWGLSRANMALGEMEPALHDLDCLLGLTDLPETVNRTSVQVRLCRTCLECGDLGRAVDLGESILPVLYDNSGTLLTEEAAELASTLALCYYQRGDMTRAQRLVDAVMARAEREGSLRGRASAFWNAALVAEARGDVRSALSLTDRALALYGELGHATAAASLRANSGWLLLRLPRPEPESAERVLQQALAELRNVGAPAIDVANAEVELARCWTLLGDTDAAIEAATSALETAVHVSSLHAAAARAVLADAHSAAGRRDTAHGVYLDAVADLECAASGYQTTRVWRQVADGLARLGQHDEAIRTYRRLADAAGAPACPTVSTSDHPSGHRERAPMRG